MKRREKEDPLIKTTGDAEIHNYTPEFDGNPIPVSKVVQIKHRKMIGYDTPNFHRRLSQGELLPYTPFTQFEISGSARGVYDYIHENGYRQVYVGEYCLRPEWEIYEDDIYDIVSRYRDDSREQVSAAAAAIYSQGWDALTFIAELKKTVLMFRSITKRLAEYMSRKDFATAWLEARYGWRPLVYDLINLNEVLQNFDEERHRFKQRVGYNIDEVVESSTIVSDAVNFYAEHSLVTSVKGSARGTIIADIKPPKIRVDPILTAWELIPYSFVVDWVIQVGSWINALHFLRISKDYQAASGVQLSISRELIPLVSYAKDPWVDATYAFKGKSEVIYTERNPATVQLTPTVNLNMSWLNVVDAIALLKKALLK